MTSRFARRGTTGYVMTGLVVATMLSAVRTAWSTSYLPIQVGCVAYAALGGLVLWRGWRPRRTEIR